MRIRFVPAFAVCVVVCGSASGKAPASASHIDEANSAATQLGSDLFSERDAAARALERMGSAALPALRAACKSSDLEVRRRAEGLVERIERAAESARLLAVTPIRLDYRNVPLGT